MCLRGGPEPCRTSLSSPLPRQYKVVSREEPQLRNKVTLADAAPIANVSPLIGARMSSAGDTPPYPNLT